jgi:MFS superfamily sulfate permease-like transporter
MSDQKSNFSKIFSQISSGFLVSLIALPLSMGIAIASGFPPLAGVATAIIGGLFTGICGGARLSIKGPAAGMIVIVLGAVNELNDPLLPGSGASRALTVCILAGGLQAIAGSLKFATIAARIPKNIIHGMLAAIGLIIIGKQIHVLLGVVPTGKDPISLYAEIPKSFLNMNPAVAMIGILSFLIMMFGHKISFSFMKKVPNAILVLILGIGWSIVCNVKEAHAYNLLGNTYILESKYLISLPSQLFLSLPKPDWSIAFSFMSLKHVILFALVGSIESVLTVLAVNSMDPAKDPSNLNKDLFSVGIGNVIAGFCGGLPMISEIVRSRANIDSGAKNGWSNWFHGFLLLAALLLLSDALRQIPLAALAGILVYVGTKLASPKDFIHMYHLGLDHLATFLTVLVVTLTVDLLAGVVAGLVLWGILRLINSARGKSSHLEAAH